MLTLPKKSSNSLLKSLRSMTAASCRPSSGISAWLPIAPSSKETWAGRSEGVEGRTE